MLRSKTPVSKTPIFVLSILLASTAPLWANKPTIEPPSPTVVGTSQPIRVTPDLTEATAAGGRLFWSERVEVEDAAFLKPHFVNVNLRAGDQLVVRSATGKVVETITGRGPKDAGSFWGLSAFGEELTLELSFARPYAAHPFTVDQVIVGDPAMLAEFAGFDEPESICTPGDFEDVFCYQSDAGKWANVLASVGVMSVGGNPASSLFCSGSNVSPQNYVLTNHHCISSTSECTNAEFVFKYYRTGCNDGSPPTADWQSFRCNETVASSPLGSCEATPSSLDFSLNSVIGDPASTFGFATPDPNPLTSGEDIYIIQHPAGRPHEITHGGGANVEVDGNNLRYYDTLDTEGGSSGSPIYREADDLLIGLHHCGGCSTPGTGNRGMLMSDIYPAIEEFLCSQSVDVTGTTPIDVGEVSGNGDTVIDPGETWQLTPVVRNVACSEEAINVEAEIQVAAGSAPVTLLDTVAVFGDIAAGATAAAFSPVRFQVDAAAPCEGSVILDLVNVTADVGGPFDDVPGYYDGEIGAVPMDVLFFEDFAGGIPGDWTVVDGGTGTGPAATWTTANPGGRSLALTDPFAIADSDELGTGETMDEELITPMIAAGSYQTVELQVAHDFNWYSGGNDEQADVDVRSTATGGAWVNVANFSGADAGGTLTVDVTAQAAGQNDFQVRFHYHNASYEWWWAVDDVFVLGNNGRVCSTGIFSDGFESGDLTNWSASAP